MTKWQWLFFSFCTNQCTALSRGYKISHHLKASQKQIAAVSIKPRKRHGKPCKGENSLSSIISRLLPTTPLGGEGNERQFIGGGKPYQNSPHPLQILQLARGGGCPISSGGIVLGCFSGTGLPGFPGLQFTGLLSGRVGCGAGFLLFRGFLGGSAVGLAGFPS